jgi:hypothetical protein
MPVIGDHFDMFDFGHRHVVVAPFFISLGRDELVSNRYRALAIVSV